MEDENTYLNLLIAEHFDESDADEFDNSDEEYERHRDDEEMEEQ